MVGSDTAPRSLYAAWLDLDHLYSEWLQLDAEIVAECFDAIFGDIVLPPEPHRCRASDRVNVDDASAPLFTRRTDVTLE